MSYRIYIEEVIFHDGGEYSEMVSSLYEQIYDLEYRLLQPEIRGSREGISMLLADDFVEFGVSGRTFDKLQVVEELPHCPAVSVIIKDFQVKVLSPDVVLATYRAVKTNESREETRNSLRSSIWKFLDGRWQIVFHQGTRTINNIQLMKGKTV